MPQWSGESTAEGSARSWRWSGGCESRCLGSGNCETASSEKRQVRRRACRHRRPHVWTLNDSSLVRRTLPSIGNETTTVEDKNATRERGKCLGDESFAQIRECRFLLSVFGSSNHRRYFWRVTNTPSLSLSLYYSLWDSDHSLTLSLSLVSLSSLRFQTITTLPYI